MSDAALRKLCVHTGTHVDYLKLICLNLDERGMWSNRLVAWCSQRFKEATKDASTQTFGRLPTVNFFGDLDQFLMPCI